MKYFRLVYKDNMTSTTHVEDVRAVSAEEGVMNDIKAIIKQLQATSSRNEKAAILEANKDNELWTEVLKFLLDPMVVTGISIQKLSKPLAKTNTEHRDLLGVMNYLRRYNTGRDVDVAVCQDLLARFPEHRDWMAQLFTKSLKFGVDTSTVNKIYGKGFIKVFAVMLAESFADNPRHLDGKEFIITQKLDGVRCVAFVHENGEVQFFTRNGQDYGEVPDVAADLLRLGVRGVAYDGELIAASKSTDSSEVFRQTVSTANRKGVKTGLIYHVFDRLPISEFLDGYSPELCTSRKHGLYKSFKGHDDIQWVEMVENLYEGNDQEKITEWSSVATKNGWEGLMLNVADAPYQAKRTRDLLKVKKFKTVDVRVTGVFEGIGALVGTLGGIHVEFDVDGEMYTSKCGSGFTFEQRDKYWAHPELLIGKIVELKCFEVSYDKDGSRSLRFPIWLDIIRTDKDETSVY